MTRRLSRREFLKVSASIAAGSVAVPYMSCGKVGVVDPLTRRLGRTEFEVTSFGLGGQASLQWTAEGIDPAAIIVKAFELGVNYFDTSNVYGPSQENYGKAFQALNLVPGLPDYDQSRRESIYLASKTMLRHARGSHPDVRDRSQGPTGSLAVDDVKRTLSQVFGDGQGAYPEGSYIDLFQIHNLNSMAEADAIFVGLNDPDPGAERIGALSALVDYRDGTDRTGLNPSHEKLIRRIGITGHFSSPVMIECLQRDDQGVIDTMLIAINANDRQYLSHQTNAIPVAKAKDVGVIAMKLFADGAMYTKEPRWSRTPEDVVHLIGTSEVPSRPLIEYALSTPGVGTAIIGIGQIENDGRLCQLGQNISAAQILPESLSRTDRDEIEQIAAKSNKGQTNWFQVPQQPLGAPREIETTVEKQDGKPAVRIAWQTAYAGPELIDYYEVMRDGQSVAKVQHQPQTSKIPFKYGERVQAERVYNYKVVTVDKGGQRTASEELEVSTA